LHVLPTYTHGKSQEEAPPQDEQAQAQEALEIEPPQKAHVAKIISNPPHTTAGFSFK
jgi:hypothetical protein